MRDTAEKLAGVFRDRLDRATADELKAMLDLLEKAEQAVIARLAAVRGDFTRTWLERLLSEIRTETANLESRLTPQADKGLRAQADIGADVANEAAERAGGSTANVAIRLAPAIDRHQLAVWADYKMDLVRNGITQATRRELEGALKQAYLTGKQPFELMQEIAEKPYSKLSFVDKFHRAEAIVRTEGGRVAAQANHERSKDYADFDARICKDFGRIARPWMKRWLSAHDARVRPTHVAVDADAAIPLQQDYIVGGEKAAYPHDPRLSAKESVNCRCISITIPPD